MGAIFKIDIADHVATITFDLPGSKVNILNQEVLQEFEQVLDGLRSNNHLKGAIILSGKKDTFIAGADISVLEQMRDTDAATALAKQGQRIFDTLAHLPFPVVAAVHGACLGGGMELALACHYRVVSNSPKTFLSQPEVQLGIIPGFGGTQRLPRLIGIIEALKMITTGSRVFAKKAVRIGLVDEMVEQEHLLAAAFKLVKKGKPTRPKNRRVQLQKLLFESNPLGRNMIFSKTRAAVIKKGGDHYPAPCAAINAVETGLAQGIQKGLELEARLLGELAVSDTAKRMISVFRLREQFTKVDRSVADRIHSIGVIGAGVMGGGIAILAAENSMQVRLINRSTRGLGRVIRALQKTTSKKRRKGIYSPVLADWIKSRFAYDTAVRGLGNADAVIEAVAEEMDTKKMILTDVAENVSKHALLLSNTSSLSISDLAEVIPNPSRVAGLHFFNPVEKMKLVEIIRGRETTDETVDKLKILARTLGKIPVVTRDSPGFLVNRLLMPYLNEAARMLEDGVSMQAIDEALLRFGMPMGAFILLDVIGLDIASHVGGILHKELGDRLQPSPILAALCEAKRLGQKSGQGFYRYTKNGRREQDPELPSLLKQHIIGNLVVNEQQIVDRNILAMVNEAAYCLEEKVVDGPAAVDAAMIFGAGFPPYTGGLLRYADAEGIPNVVRNLTTLAETAGKRFIPANLLKKMAENGDLFHPM